MSDTKPKVFGYLKRDRCEDLKLNAQTRMRTAWRIVNHMGEDLIQPWPHTRYEAKTIARELGIVLLETHEIVPGQVLWQFHKPYYIHDCSECGFLGNYTHPTDSTEYDLYHHNTETIIARYGNQGWDYTSGVCFAGIDAALTIAYSRALEKGIKLRHSQAKVKGPL